MRIDVITLFPEMFDALHASIPGRAQKAGALALHTHQLRDHAVNRHGQVDDTPYGGEAGMVLRPEPLRDSLNTLTQELNRQKPHVIFLSAQGKLLTQSRAMELSRMENLALVCGHYKGIDQRFVDACVDEEICIGDYVLSGGELAAMVLIDTVARLLPGVLGDIESAETDSFQRPGRLGWPVYTRPPEFDGHAVPQALLSGHHAKIREWQILESLRMTQENRPELLDHHPVTPEEDALLHPPPPRRKRRKRASESD